MYNKVIQFYMYTQPFFFQFFSQIDHHRTLGGVLCAIQQVSIGQSFHMPQCAYANPKPPGTCFWLRLHNQLLWGIFPGGFVKLPDGDVGEPKHLKQPHRQSPCSLVATKVLAYRGEYMDSAEPEILIQRPEFKIVYTLEKSSKRGLGSTSDRERFMGCFVEGPSVSHHSEGQGEEYGMSKHSRAVCFLASPCRGCRKETSF